MSGFRNRLYYGLKPLIPASARHIRRKWFAQRQRKQCGRHLADSARLGTAARRLARLAPGKKIRFRLDA